VTRSEAAAIQRQTAQGFRDWSKRTGNAPLHWAAKRRQRSGEGGDSTPAGKSRAARGIGGDAIRRGGERNRTAGKGISLGGEMTSPKDTPPQIQHKP